MEGSEAAPGPLTALTNIIGLEAKSRCYLCLRTSLGIWQDSVWTSKNEQTKHFSLACTIATDPSDATSVSSRSTLPPESRVLPKSPD